MTTTYNIPDIIWILGIPHDVHIEPIADDQGLYENETRTIRIDADTPSRLHTEIFLHEVCEGINDILDLGLKHTQICAFGVVFHDVLKQMEAK